VKGSLAATYRHGDMHAINFGSNNKDKMGNGFFNTCSKNLEDSKFGSGSCKAALRQHLT
jgi:hypothetical protein